MQKNRSLNPPLVTEMCGSNKYWAQHHCKIKYIFSFHSSCRVLIFTFDMRIWMTYLFCIIKNNKNKIGEKKEKEKNLKEKNQTYYLRNHIILFVSLRGTDEEYLFPVICFLILRENSLSEGEILDNTFFYKIVHKSKFLFTTVTRLRCLKHQMALQMLSAFVFLGKQNLWIVWK